MKKVVKISGWVALTPIILFLLLAILFYFPPFQNWAVRQAASIASEQTGLEISVERVGISFPLNLAAEGIMVLQPNDSFPQSKDTIADIKRAIVDIRLLPLLKLQVAVDELDLQAIRFNTSNLIASSRVSGIATELKLKSRAIDLKRETVMLDDVFLDGGDVEVLLCDSVPRDTAESNNNWNIALQQLQVNNTSVRASMNSDSLRIGAFLGKCRVCDGVFDLGKGIYQIGRTDFTACRLDYNLPFEPKSPGFDYNHLSFSNLTLGGDSLYFQAPCLGMKIRGASFDEKSGLQLQHLSGAVNMDSTTLTIPHLVAETSDSHVQLTMVMDLNAFDQSNSGQLKLKVNAQLGKKDVMLFAEDMPQSFRMLWPHYPLSLDCDVDGSLRHLNVNTLKAELPTAFSVSAKGYLSNVFDAKSLFANIDVAAKTYNVDFLANAFIPSDLHETLKIPRGLSLDGNVFANGQTYNADFCLQQGGGRATLKGSCCTAGMAYQANLAANAFPVQHFLPGLALSPFSGKISISGAGTDVFSSKTRFNADATIDSFHYADVDLSGTTARASISAGVAKGTVNCANELINGSIALDALLNSRDVKATMICSLDNVDVYGMNLTETPFSTSLCAHVDIASDLQDFYKVEGIVSDVVIRDSVSAFRPEELQVDVFTRQDTTWAKVSSGDMSLDLAASGGWRSLLSVADNLTSELERQIERKYISQDSLKQVLPIGHLTFRSGKNNFLARYAERLDYAFRETSANLRTSPVDGINGYVQIDSLFTAGMQLDKIRLDLLTDASGFKYKGQLKNEKNNPQYSFNALFDGSLFETGSDVNVALYDKDNELGLRLGLRAAFEENGIRVKLADTNAILGYRRFRANADNFLFLADDKRVSANMKLKADDGTGLQIYSDDENLEALQDITLGINYLDLSSIVAIIPYFPRVNGILNGDFHVIQTPDELSVSSSLGIDGLVYEGYKMGDISTEFVYIPLEDNSHYVDGVLMHNGDDVGTIKGTYSIGESADVFDAQVDLTHLPLDLVNGFIPDQVIGLRGLGDGTLSIHGPLNAMQINGSLDLHDAFLVSVPYGVELRFDDCPVKIEDSKLLLRNFNMYSHNEQPLVMNGHVDFSNLSRMSINMRMRARNFLVIDSKENRKSEVFGKTYVNFDAMMSGPLSAIKMRGNLDVLGSTNMTYIMRDTPLTNDNRLAELVKFTDLSDETVENNVERPTIEGLSVDLNIAIDQGARVFCALNANKSNYLDLIGGGNLRMVYRDDNLALNGRYTISSGEMKYSLPVIPLKTFDIRNGSYVEFTGDVMNPRLNITAVEENKASVSVDGASRSVFFNCGVVITKTLNDMGLEFIIEAPEDLAVNGELQTMSVEERGKIAVTMLTTGMYLTDGNTSSFTMNSALSSFLQSEINSITAGALRTLDLSIGLDNTTDAAGALHTDYSFKFAKRFWNNRVNVVVGGKVSTGDAMNQSLFNNVSLEYRLDQSANTNLKLFYDHAKYDYLEGYVGQYGAGLVWKRKLQNFSDIFKLKGTSGNSLPMRFGPDGMRRDSLRVTPARPMTENRKGGAE